MCRRRRITAPPGSHRLIHHARMFIVVAIKTEQFPVAAISRIIVVIVVFVMYGQLAQTHSGKFAPASAAYPWKQSECLLAITFLTQFALLTRFEDNAIQPRLVGSGVFSHGASQVMVEQTIAGGARHKKCP